ncbi:MAG TPA: hypothetical protein VE198_23960 [Actinoallomurus sp.]|nr:hypothetical protein [Actinoallomurus sp.]
MRPHDEVAVPVRRDLDVVRGVVVDALAHGRRTVVARPPEVSGGSGGLLIVYPEPFDRI